MFARRLKAIRQRVAASQLQGLLLTSLPNIRYLTGFTGSNAGLLIFPNRVIFFTDARYTLQGRQEIHGADLVVVKGNLVEGFIQGLSRGRGKRIGFDPDSMTVSLFRLLKKNSSNVSFIPVKGLVEQNRMRKEPGELSKVRAAVEISDRVFTKILAILRPGIKELDVAAEISYWHRSFGAESDAFEPIVASGPRGALPHARASAHVVRKGDMVTIDMGCVVDGYCSDLTRTVAVGKPSKELKRMYGVVLDAQRRAIDAVRAGIPAATVDAKARKAIQSEGYGKFFTHSLGHGVGLEIHELPRVSAKSKDILEAGMVITVEPGIYIPRVGGVRIEDDVVIKGKGIEVLNRAPKGLVIV